MPYDYSILVGGKAGDGVMQAGESIAALLGECGYFIFAYNDYPSVIRGSHNFCIVRASEKKIAAHNEQLDLLVALDENTLKTHSHRLKQGALVIFDSDLVKAEGLGLPLSRLAREKNLPLIVRNSAMLGILAAIIDADFSLVEKVIKESLHTKVEENISLAREVYEETKKTGKKFSLPPLPPHPQRLASGNEALALGAVMAGLEMYIAYPMTPATPILHYLAQNQKKYNLKVIHPENEIAVVGMAQGAAYAGKRTMVGTSGGGFALMVEHLSLSGQAELPTIFVLSQRPGPATGLPTYSGQGELFFALSAGHGEFARLVVAPGDLEEAVILAAEAVNIAWELQIPAIILIDKHLGECLFSVDPQVMEMKNLKREPKLWNKEGVYQRYAPAGDGVSPLAFPGEENAVVKANGYEHDAAGITTEAADLAKQGMEKRRQKMKTLEEKIKDKETVKIYGNRSSKNALLFWGSTKGSVLEAGENFDCRLIQPLYLNPFPADELKKALEGAERLIDIECNLTGQLATLMENHGFKINDRILKYDGRPFTPGELKEKLETILK